MGKLACGTQVRGWETMPGWTNLKPTTPQLALWIPMIDAPLQTPQNSPLGMNAHIERYERIAAHGSGCFPVKPPLGNAVVHQVIDVQRPPVFERRIELLEAVFGVNRPDKFDNVVLVHTEIFGKVRMAAGVWSAFPHVRDDPTQDERFVEQPGLDRAYCVVVGSFQTQA